jgi:hypothetical protein
MIVADKNMPIVATLDELDNFKTCAGRNALALEKVLVR